MKAAFRLRDLFAGLSGAAPYLALCVATAVLPALWFYGLASLWNDVKDKQRAIVSLETHKAKLEKYAADNKNYDAETIRIQASLEKLRRSFTAYEELGGILREIYVLAKKCDVTVVGSHISENKGSRSVGVKHKIYYIELEFRGDYYNAVNFCRKLERDGVGFAGFSVRGEQGNGSIIVKTKLRFIGKI